MLSSQWTGSRYPFAALVLIALTQGPATCRASAVPKASMLLGRSRFKCVRMLYQIFGLPGEAGGIIGSRPMILNRTECLQAERVCGSPLGSLMRIAIITKKLKTHQIRRKRFSNFESDIKKTFSYFIRSYSVRIDLPLGRQLQCGHWHFRLRVA